VFVDLKANHLLSRSFAAHWYGREEQDRKYWAALTQDSARGFRHLSQLLVAAKICGGSFPDLADMTGVE